MRRPVTGTLWAALTATLAGCLLLPAAAGADTFTVTTGASSGSGSLRQAVLDANTHPGHDTIEFAPGVRSIIVGSAPGASDIAITGDVDIVGPGATKLDVLGFNSRVFEVSKSATVAISGMTMKAGGTFGNTSQGGAVLNDGTLTLTGITFQDNKAKGPPDVDSRGGAIANSGTVNLRNSVLDGNGAASSGSGSADGGAIFNSGTMAIDGSKLTNNAATGTEGAEVTGDGGAIANVGDLQITDSTLEGNVARGGSTQKEGGPALGGAISNSGGATLTVRSSTLNHNSAFGGIATVGTSGVGGLAIGGGISNAGDATFHLENATLTLNQAVSNGVHEQTQAFGGAVSNQSPASASSSVLATTMSGNKAFEGASISLTSPNLSLQDTVLTDPKTPFASRPGENCGHPGGLITVPRIDSRGYNIDSGSSCELKAAGDKSDTDPQLKPLGDNRGPTQTMAIPLSSPALDQGVNGGLTTDQRGERRPVIVPGVPRPEGGDGSDIGAYEYQPLHRGHQRIKGTVKPGRTHAGERTCFKLKAEHPNGGPVKKAQVKMGGKRARTDERGKATICKRFKHEGVRHPRIRKRGLERAKLRVNVRP